MSTISRALVAISGIGLLASCAVNSPPPLPPDNPADPQARESSRPGAFLLVDSTTRAITDQLRHGPEVAEKHGGNMPGMQHDMTAIPEKKALAEEMKKTSEEMKKTAEALKQKETMPAATSYYTCPMHSQVHQDKPGKCPICGMDLVKKEGPPPK